MGENVQWSNSYKKSPSRFVLLSIIGVVVLAIVLPVIILFTRNAQDIRQHASPLWSTTISATAACSTSQGGNAIISFTFKNTDTFTMSLIVTDSQTSKVDTVGQVSPGQTKNGQINTGVTSLKDGTLSFNLTGNGSSDTKQIPYTGIQCNGPSITPSPSLACTAAGITLDTKSGTSQAGVTSVTWKHTTTAHSNSVLIVGVGADNGTRNTRTYPVPAKSITYNGIALTKIAEKNCNLDRCSDEIWYMKDPPSGQHNVVVTLSAQGSVNAGSATFYNVDPSTPYTNFVTNVNNGDPSVVVPNTISSQVIVDVGTLDDDATNMAASHGGSLLWMSRDSSQLTISGGQYTPASDGSTTVGFKVTAAYPEEYGEIALPLNAAQVNCTTPTPTPGPTDTPTPTPTEGITPGITPTPTQGITPTPTPPICQAGSAVCKWDADSVATTYNVIITDLTNGSTNTSQVQAPQTFLSYPSIPGHSYSCTVSGQNSCGIGGTGSKTFTCNLPTPTPTSCPAPQAPNVRISCPNCTGQ